MGKRWSKLQARLYNLMDQRLTFKYIVPYTK